MRRLNQHPPIAKGGIGKGVNESPGYLFSSTSASSSSELTSTFTTPVRNSNKSNNHPVGRVSDNTPTNHLISTSSTSSNSNSTSAFSPRRFGNSTNNWNSSNNRGASSGLATASSSSGNSSNYLENAKRRLRRSPSPPSNRNRHRQQQQPLVQPQPNSSSSISNSSDIKKEGSASHSHLRKGHNNISSISGPVNSVHKGYLAASPKRGRQRGPVNTNPHPTSNLSKRSSNSTGTSSGVAKGYLASASPKRKTSSQAPLQSQLQTGVPAPGPGRIHSNSNSNSISVQVPVKKWNPHPQSSKLESVTSSNHTSGTKAPVPESPRAREHKRVDSSTTNPSNTITTTTSATKTTYRAQTYTPASAKVKVKNNKDKDDNDMTMQESGDQANVWVRHSLLLNILNPKPSYGSSASASTSTTASISTSNSSIISGVSNGIGNGTGLHHHAAVTPAKKTNSFIKNSPFHNGNVIRNMSSSITTNITASSTNDDISTCASTTSSGTSHSTATAKWGWVKALVLNNDAFTQPRKHGGHGRKVDSDGNGNGNGQSNSQPVPAWKKQLKNKHSGNGQNAVMEKPTPESARAAPAQPVALSLKIIDLESEFHGQTIEVPLSMLGGKGNGKNKGNSNGSGHSSVNGNGNKNGNTSGSGADITQISLFGDVIVMANAWPDFTKLPEMKDKASSGTATATEAVTPKSKWSAYKVKSVHTHTPKEEETKDASDQDSKVPSDLTNLSHLHEPAVVFCLRYRYAMNEIYTATGPILLALNPFKEVKGIYGDDLMRKYCDRGQGLMSGVVVKRKTEGKGSKLPPHVYAVADSAYRAMMRAMEDANGGMSDEISDQSILVSGESGAGKTVTTKIIMKYLANLSKRSGTKKVEKKPIANRWNSGPQNYSTPKANAPNVASPGSIRGRNIEQQVLESNPILESFGNARTIRNDNSSRFGKFIEIKFTSSGKLMGASVDSYLLEKVRLINQADGERNYHIFYELLAGASGADRKELLLGRSSPQDFVMTTSLSETYKRRDGVRDDTTFGALRKAMVTMGFSPADFKQILCIVSSLLHLSNTTFTEDSSGCTLDTDNSSLQPALQLLGVSAKALEQALCCVNIEAGGEKVVKKLFLHQSAKAKEALIKATYGALFSYLVRRINNCINGKITNPDPDDADTAPPPPSAAAFIGVLDIFGFESFEKNSFEQLCINYCNESLQQQFNRFVFKLEQAEYESENIQWDFISFPDNQNVLDLIDKKRVGILSILDESSFLTQCTDQSFAQLIYQNAGGGGRPIAGTHAFTANSRQMANGVFSINHYAGPVEYDTNGFLEKNKDELPKEIGDLLHSSENIFLRELATVMDSTNLPNENSAAGRTTPFKQNSLKRITVGGQFSSQLQLLRKRIDATSPHYVRCLKPNDKLEPDNFDSAVIADQLRCAGILEAVRVSRVGYPQRYLHERFVQRYQVLALKELHLRRKDASSNFTSPVGVGFHGGFLPKSTTKSKRPTPAKKTIHRETAEKRLNPEQECKILVTALARQLHAASQNNVALDGSDVESTSPVEAKAWVSPGKMKKQAKWATPGGSRYSTPVSKKKQELDLMELGIQFGKTKVFLRQHAFEILEVMRNRIKAEAATLLNSVFRMYLKRRRYLVIQDEYRARVAQRSKMIQEGGIVSENFLVEAANASFERAEQFDFKEMDRNQITVHREEDDRSAKDYKWVMVDNRWIKSAEDDAIEN